MLKFFKRLPLALAVPAGAALTVGAVAGAAAHPAVVSYQDTRITGTPFAAPAAPPAIGTGAGDASDTTTAGVPTVTLAAEAGITPFVLGTLPAGMTFSSLVLASGTVQSASVPLTVRFGYKDGNGNVSVLTANVTGNGTNDGISLVTTGTPLSTDIPSALSLSNDNMSGNIDFFLTTSASSSAQPATGFTVSDAPDNFSGTRTGNVLDASLGAVPPGGVYDGVKVSLTDVNGATLNSAFTLTVNSAASTGTVAPRPFRTLNSTGAGSASTGAVVNLGHPNLCLDARNAFGSATAGTELQVWQCGASGGEDQQFTYNPVARSLSFQGLDVTDQNTAGGNAVAVLEPAGSTGNQVVSYRPGSLFQFGDGHVLDAYGPNPGNGRLVRAAAFSGSHNQWWSLP